MIYMQKNGFPPQCRPKRHVMLCIICHEEIRTGEGKVYSCGHVFHGPCAANWFSSISNPKTCPSCRTQVDPSKSTTLYIATEVSTPQQPSRMRTLRLEQENSYLKREVDNLRADKLKIELDMEVLRVQLDEAKRRIESQRIASILLAAEEPHAHELYDSLHPQEASQLLVSYQKEIHELHRKYLALQQEHQNLQDQISMKDVHNGALQNEIDILRADLAFLENIGVRTGSAFRTLPSNSPSASAQGEAVTPPNRPPLAGSPTSSEVQSVTRPGIRTSINPAARRMTTIGTAGAHANRTSVTSAAALTAASALMARSVAGTSAATHTRSGRAAGASATLRSGAATRNGASSGTTIAARSGAAGGNTAATRIGASATRTGSDVSGVTRDSLRSSRRVSIGAVPAKIARK